MKSSRLIKGVKDVYRPGAPQEITATHHGRVHEELPAFPSEVNRVMSARRREIAGVTVPDTPLIARSMEEARALSEPYLFNHAVRSWLFAVQLAELQGVSYDEEVVAVASLLHGVGLTRKYQSKRRFEVEGTDAARALAKAGGLDDRKGQLIWYRVALNATLSISPYAEPEVGICTAGAGADFGGLLYERIPKAGAARAFSRRSLAFRKSVSCRSVCVVWRGRGGDDVRELRSGFRRAVRRGLQTRDLDRGASLERTVRRVSQSKGALRCRLSGFASPVHRCLSCGVGTRSQNEQRLTQGENVELKDGPSID